MVYRKLRRNGGWDGNVDNRQPDFYNDLLCPVGERLRQLDLPDDNGDSKSVARGSDIRVGESDHDLFRREQYTDGDRRIGYHVRLVYRKLWRNGGWNWNIDSRQPDFDHDLLCPLGE